MLMQHYLALTASELLAPTPPNRDAICVEDKDVPPNSSWEETTEDARDDAALESLHLAREEQSAPTRLVVGGTLPNRDAHFGSWQQVDEIYADDTRGQEICAKLFLAQTQEEADLLVEQLFEEALMWYDISERADLGDALVRAKPLDEVRED